jgi:hypothetical protein
MGEEKLLHGQLTREILGCAIEVHRHLGPGLLESVYRTCLREELSAHGVAHLAEVPIPIRYKERVLETGYRADLIVANTVLLELKSVEDLMPVHDAQLLTYLRLSQLRVGLLINFNVRVLTQGIRRLVH